MVDAHEKTYSKDPNIMRWWKYPSSKSLPAGNAAPNKRKTWKDPIQLISEVVRSVSDILYQKYFWVKECTRRS